VQHDAEERMTAEEAQLHPWFVEQGLVTAEEAADSAACGAEGCAVDYNNADGSLGANNVGDYNNVVPMQRSASTDSLRSAATAAI